MQWAEVSIQTTHEATDVVAEIYHDLGASGVVIEDPELLNNYIDAGQWDFSGIERAADTSIVTVKAYLPMDEDLDDKLRTAPARFPGIPSVMKIGRIIGRLISIRKRWAACWSLSRPGKITKPALTIS